MSAQQFIEQYFKNHTEEAFTPLQNSLVRWAIDFQSRCPNFHTYLYDNNPQIIQIPGPTVALAISFDDLIIYPSSGNIAIKNTNGDIAIAAQNDAAIVAALGKLGYSVPEQSRQPIPLPSTVVAN